MLADETSFSSFSFCLFNSPWDQYEGGWIREIFFLNLLFSNKHKKTQQTPPNPELNPLKRLVRSSGFALSLLADFPSRWWVFTAFRLVQLCCSPSAALSLQSLCRRASLLLMQYFGEGNFLHLPSFPPSFTLLGSSPRSRSLSPPQRSWGLCGRAQEDGGGIGRCGFKSAVVPSFSPSSDPQSSSLSQGFPFPCSSWALRGCQLESGVLQPQLTCLYLWYFFFLSNQLKSWNVQPRTLASAPFSQKTASLCACVCWTKLKKCLLWIWEKWSFDLHT